MDCGSSDRTRELAAAAGARVVDGAPWPGFVAQRNLARGRRPPRLGARPRRRRARHARAARRDPGRARRAASRHAGYRIPRVAFYLGRWIRGTDWYPDPQLRLFDRRRGRWQGGAGPRVRARGGQRRTAARARWSTSRYADVSDHLRDDRPLHHALGAAGVRGGPAQRGRSSRVVAAVWAFLRNYVLRGGFLLGEAGLTVSDPERVLHLREAGEAPASWPRAARPR